MKILVTGARGFVGARIMDVLDGAKAAPSLRDMTRDDIRRWIDAERPDAIVHTAAVSDIGECAADPEGSYRANVDIPVWIAETGVKAVLFSSDQVYSGCVKPGPYVESDACPENLYSREKLEMEERVLSVNPDAVLLRATWMYDMPRYGTPNRPNFLTMMLGRDALAFSDRAYRGLTYVREVAANIEAALRLPGGAYNYGSENDLTTFETARRFAEALDLKVRLSGDIWEHDFSMNCDRLRAGGVAFSSTLEGLLRCAEDYNLSNWRK